MSDFPFDTFRGIQNGDDATLDDVNVQQITFPDGSTQNQAATPSSQVTGLGYEGTTLTLTQSSGIGDLTTTIPSGALPFAFAQTDDTEEITTTSYNNTPLPGGQITDLTKSITPTSSSQKVVIHVNLFGEWASNPQKAGVMLERKIGSATATVIQPQNAGSRMAVGSMFCATFPSTIETSSTIEISNFVFVDSPDTTDQVTYTPRVVHRDNDNASYFLNRTVAANNHLAYPRGFSTMTLECKNV